MKTFFRPGVLLLLMLAISSASSAANPVVRYFSRLLDETRAEIAIGELIKEHLLREMPASFAVASDVELTARMKKLAENSIRADMNYSVMIISSDIPDEIPLPGGTLMLTSGLLAAAATQEQRDFLLARNIMHMALKHPMKLIKNEGLYPKLLNQLKMAPEKRNSQQLRALIRDYLMNLPKMDQKKADLQGILLTPSPDNTRKAAISMLSGFSVRVWPVMPWDTSELPVRINELEKLKLPE
jgi:hypothetical protein